MNSLLSYLKTRILKLKKIILRINNETYSRTDTSLKKRIVLAAISLFISLLFWVFIAWNGNNEGTKNIAVNLEYENLPKGHIIYAPTKNIEVKISGKVSTITRVEHADIKATVDLENLSVGTYNLPIKVEVPATVRLRSWNKTTVPVELSRYIERKIPLTWRIEGDLPEGKVVSSVNISPKEVTVGGAESDILSIQAVNAILPDLMQYTGNDIKAKIEIIGVENKQNRDRISISSKFANVKIKLEDEIQVDKIPVKVSITGSPYDGLEINTVKIIPDMVSIYGKKSAIDKMKELILPPIDITGLEQNIQLMVPIRPIDLESEIELRGPDRVRVEITLRNKITTTTFTNINIALVGANLTQFKLEPKVATVTIEASQSTMNTLNNSVPFSLYVDVSNVVSKQISLPILIKNLKYGVDIKTISPEEVEVTNLSF